MGSGKIASKRLKEIISKDRELLSPGSFRVLKKELGLIISKYLDIDKRKVKVVIEQPDNESYNLTANLPIKEGNKKD
jgi:cell division topological specificity factor MinE